jgi:general L-amino acid transport system permease protein
VFKAVPAPTTPTLPGRAWRGACWGVVAEKYRLIIFGRYPFEQQWRPAAGHALLVAVLVASCMRRFWNPGCCWLWAAALALFFVLMKGGVAGLSRSRPTAGAACR